MGRYKVDIPDELWREARVDALEQGLTISQWVERAVTSRLTGKNIPRIREDSPQARLPNVLTGGQTDHAKTPR